jgi:DNA polymerase III delta subunit
MQEFVLIGGENQFAANEELEKFKTEYLRKYPSAEIKSYFADEVDSLSKINELTGGVGLFTNISLVIMRNLLSDGSAKLREEVQEYIETEIKSKQPNDNVKLVLFERQKIDKRSKLYKLFKTKLALKDYPEPSDLEKEKLIKDFAWTQKWEIGNEVRRELLNLLLGQNIDVINSELEKLRLLLQAEGVNTLSVEHLGIINREVQQEIWLMFQTAQVDKQKAYNLLDNLLDQQVHHTQIIGFLSAELRKLINYYYFPNALPPFIRQKIRSQAQSYTPQRLKMAIDKLFNLDLALKSTPMDPRLGLTLYLSIL